MIFSVAWKNIWQGFWQSDRWSIINKDIGKHWQPWKLQKSFFLKFKRMVQNGFFKKFQKFFICKPIPKTASGNLFSCKRDKISIGIGKTFFLLANRKTKNQRDNEFKKRNFFSLWKCLHCPRIFRISFILAVKLIKNVLLYCLSVFKAKVFGATRTKRLPEFIFFTRAETVESLSNCTW